MHVLKAGNLRFEQSPLNQTIYENSSATFVCIVNGSKDSINVTWEKDRIMYTENNASYSDGVSNLTLNRATVADGGKYRCKATNVDGASSISIEAELIS